MKNSSIKLIESNIYKLKDKPKKSNKKRDINKIKFKDSFGNSKSIRLYKTRKECSTVKNICIICLKNEVFTNKKCLSCN